MLKFKVLPVKPRCHELGTNLKLFRWDLRFLVQMRYYIRHELFHIHLLNWILLEANWLLHGYLRRYGGDQKSKMATV